MSVIRSKMQKNTQGKEAPNFSGSCLISCLFSFEDIHRLRKSSKVKKKCNKFLETKPVKGKRDNTKIMQRVAHVNSQSEGGWF